MNSRLHMLPDGASTDDDDLYISRWRETFAAIEDVTPWRVIGFDPGYLLDTGNRTTLSLDINQMRVLNDICKELLELRKAK